MTKLQLLASCLLLCAMSAMTRAAEPNAAVPHRGGTLHLAFQNELHSLDPAIAYDGFDIPLVRLMFRGLLDYDDATGLVNSQAKDWNISADGRTYTFHLLPGTRFANGREVEAEDYVFSLERVLSPQTSSPGQTFYLPILGAEEFTAGKTNHVRGLRAPDKGTLVIELKEPLYTFRYVLAMTFADAVPREVVQQYGNDFKDHLQGSGPYRLAGRRYGISWRLERNPHYQGADGFVDAVDIMIGGNDATLMMMLERGEIDQVAYASDAQGVQFRLDPRLRSWLVRVDTAQTDYVFMNTEIKPFDDARVRQAVNYAIDRKRVIKLGGGFRTLTCGIVPPSMPWNNPDLPNYDYNPEKARTLLREAGYPHGFKTEIWPADANFVLMAESVQQDLHQVGIEAEFKQATVAAFTDKAQTRHQMPMGVWGWFQDYPDASDFLDVLFNGARITETGCNNTSFYNNPQVNQLLDAAGKSLDHEERTRLFHQAETLIMRDAPFAPLDNSQTLALYNPRVHGAAPHPVWMWRYEKMWLSP